MIMSPRHQTLVIACVLSGAMFVPSSSASAQPPMVVPLTAPFVGAVHASTYIFQGLVLARDSSTMDFAPGGTRRTVVLVEQALRSRGGIASFAGQPVTVIVRDSPAVTVGARAAFFTSVSVAGETLLLDEILRMPVTSVSDLREIQFAITRADSVLLEREIAASGRDASVVILGTVAGFREVPPSRDRDDSFAWQRASVTVDAKLFPTTGPALASVSVLFATDVPGSMVQAPVLYEGQRSILFLRSLARLPLRQRAGIDTTSAYYVLRSADVRDASDSARVVRVLK